MNKGLTMLFGLGLGAGLMYLLDPAKGRRRRALLRDKLVSATGRVDDYLDTTWRDLRHRAQGLAAEASDLWASDEPDDRVVAERVRSKIGRYVSHPGSIEVAVNDGRVTLGGPVLAREVDWLLAAVASVPGVTGVENRLEIHARPGNVPGLQGGGTPPGERMNLMEENWAPATRLLAGAAGAGLMANCLARRTPLAVLLGTAGFGLFLRSLTNESLGRLIGVSGGRRAVDVHKTVTVAGPPERAFRFFERYEAFPRFMSHIREVRDLGGGRSHWVAEGPAGMAVSWDAVITRHEPNRVLAWRSEPGSAVPNAGIIRFEPTPEGNTRVDIRFSYNPPGGALGHFAARLFGADVKSAMDDDMVRLKSLIEAGKTSAPGKGETRREDVGAGEARPTS